MNCSEEITVSKRMLRRGTAELERISKVYDDADSYEACQYFGRQVVILDGLVAAVYAQVVHCTRTIEDLNEISTLWNSYLGIVDDVITVVERLKDLYPYCGTPELYDHTLDYRNAAKRRRDNILEEIQCLDKTPSNLFPK